MTQTTTFTEELTRAIMQAIKDAKRDGTVGMSLGNLRQSTKTNHLLYLADSPKGTNAVWVFRGTFRHVCESNKTIAKFITNWD